MIIDNFDLSTEKGLNEFNEKYKGEFEATSDNNGSISLVGLPRNKSFILSDHNGSMFDSKKNKELTKQKL